MDLRKRYPATSKTKGIGFAITLRDLVQQESPSEDRPAVNASRQLWSNTGPRNHGARIKRHRQKEFGDVLELRFGPPRSSRKPMLLLGHLDTVWPIGTLKKMPWREADGRYWGPGVLDMKAGVVMALAALRTLQEILKLTALSSCS